MQDQIRPSYYALLLADAAVRRKLNREQVERDGHQTHVTLRYELPQMNRKERRAREAKGRKK